MAAALVSRRSGWDDGSKPVFALGDRRPRSGEGSLFRHPFRLLNGPAADLKRGGGLRVSQSGIFCFFFVIYGVGIFPQLPVLDGPQFDRDQTALAGRQMPPV